MYYNGNITTNIRLVLSKFFLNFQPGWLRTLPAALQSYSCLEACCVVLTGLKTCCLVLPRLEICCLVFTWIPTV
jgi:hypothetical protein